MATSFKLMLFFWQVGLVDTFSLIQFCVNSGSQYGAIVVACAAGNFSDIGPKVLFEPFKQNHRWFISIKSLGFG